MVGVRDDAARRRGPAAGRPCLPRRDRRDGRRGHGDRDIPAVFVGSGGNGSAPEADSLSVRLGLRRLGFEAGDPDGTRRRGESST